MPTIPRFGKGRPIPAVRLNQVVDGVNALNLDKLPRQEDRGAEGPLVTDDEKTEQAAVEVWNEVSRTVETVRVENPDDSEQYVDVERVQTITLRRDNGELILMRLSND